MYFAALGLGTHLFVDPVNLLRAVVVALNKDSILDPSSSHLLASLFYCVRPVHTGFLSKIVQDWNFRKVPVYLWLFGRWEAMGRVLIWEAGPHTQVKDVEMAVHNLSLCHCSLSADALKSSGK